MDDHTTIAALIAIVGSSAGGMIWVIKLLVRQLVSAVNEFKAFREECKPCHEELHKNDAAILVAVEKLMQHDEWQRTQSQKQNEILESIAHCLNKLANGGISV